MMGTENDGGTVHRMDDVSDIEMARVVVARLENELKAATTREFGARHDSTVCGWMLGNARVAFAESVKDSATRAILAGLIVGYESDLAAKRRAAESLESARQVAAMRWNVALGYLGRLKERLAREEAAGSPDERS